MKTFPDSQGVLRDPEIILNYILSGRGVVTLESPSGKCHTYAYYKPRNPNDFPDDILFVYAVHGGNKLFYIGMIEGTKFRLTRNSRFLEDTEIVRGARYIMRMATSSFNTPMKLYHEGVCCRCGRKLIAPDSIKTGIGPKCRCKVGQSNAH